MREILFRGQTRRYGEKVTLTGAAVKSNWVYGGIYQGNGDFSIIYSYDDIKKYSVYTETVGQYTGLTDKNGTKIFEGDIVSNNGTPPYLFSVCFGRCGGTSNVPEPHYGYQGFFLSAFDEYTAENVDYGLRDDLCYWLHGVTIIGNIYDKQEDKE